MWRFDPEILRFKVQFLLLIQLVASKVFEILKNRPQDPYLDEKGKNPDVSIGSVEILNQILCLGVRRLQSDVEHDVEVLDEGFLVSEDELRGLWWAFLDNAEVFDVLCGNIQRQTHPAGPYESKLAISVRMGATESLGSTLEELEVLGQIQRRVQMVHLDALKEAADMDDLDFLHQYYGVEETEYMMVMQVLIMKALSENTH